MLRAWTTDGNDEAVVVKAFNDTVLKKSLMTLGERLWLGDEVNVQAVEAASTPCKFTSSPSQTPSRRVIRDFFTTVSLKAFTTTSFWYLRRYLWYCRCRRCYVNVDVDVAVIYGTTINNDDYLRHVFSANLYLVLEPEDCRRFSGRRSKCYFTFVACVFMLLLRVGAECVDGRRGWRGC